MFQLLSYHEGKNQLCKQDKTEETIDYRWLVTKVNICAAGCCLFHFKCQSYLILHQFKIYRGKRLFANHEREREGRIVELNHDIEARFELLSQLLGKRLHTKCHPEIINKNLPTGKVVGNT